ncbi:HET-domain-containing protein [Echria macrotheca]|uniref:HET-domain-containing protein n=1 Tax=Echria macrotheca TaxID=438768 RepID=A0AAJ0F9C5_9PEZI|nr:HET-domain-containing protein [Echria macrotheca]
MRISSLCLAACAGVAVQSLGSTDSCHSRPAPPCLACGVDDVDGTQLPLKCRDLTNNETVPSRWEGPGRCAGRYCIYSNRGFANGRGIVAITTAASFAILRTLKETSTDQTDPAPPYYLAPVPGKGLGLIANRTLHRGDALMIEPPAVLVHRGLLETVPPATQHPLLDEAITNLPAARRETFLAQMGHFQGHRVASILATNTFQMDIGGPDGHHFGSFPEVSRLNHDCRPNVAFRLDYKTLTHRTTVVRDVRPGEELSITYLDSAEPRARRMHRARQAWGFTCGCSQCRLADAAAAKSDRRLEEMKAIEARLADFGDDGVNAGLLRRLVRLYKDERMEVEMGGAYTLVALNYNMLGDAKNAVKYARLAREAVVIEGGEEAGDAEAMSMLAEAPKEHFTWRARVR